MYLQLQLASSQQWPEQQTYLDCNWTLLKCNLTGWWERGDEVSSERPQIPPDPLKYLVLEVINKIRAIERVCNCCYVDKIRIDFIITSDKITITIDIMLLRGSAFNSWHGQDSTAGLEDIQLEFETGPLRNISLTMEWNGGSCKQPNAVHTSSIDDKGSISVVLHCNWALANP